jgi:hypothetical protein
MLKAGLIGAAVGCVLAIVAAVAFPALCNPCAAVFVGLATGALAAVLSRSCAGRSAAAAGAQAGAIATAGSLLGQMIGTAVMGATLDPAVVAEAAAEMSRLWGLTVTDPELYAEVYGPVLLVSSLLCGLMGVALGAGSGALGGLLWHQFRRQGEEIAAPPEEG